MKELYEAIKEEKENKISEAVERIKADGVATVAMWHNKKYKGDEKTQEKKLLRYIKRKAESREAEQLKRVEEVEQANDFGGTLTITVEWKRSYMWGMNPRAFTNYGFNGRSIGGCGYCKHSTATAEALNSHKPLMKLLYLKESKRLRELNKSRMTKEDQEKYLSRRSFVGYGAGYSIIPSFEGGVGVSSHESIVKGLGLEMRGITSTKHVDVHQVTKNKS